MIRKQHSLYKLILLCIVILSLNVGFASADGDDWANITGGDHGGADWTPDNGTTIAGTHYNIGTFTVINGYNINIDATNELEINAEIINIVGTIDGDGDGYAYGTGDGKGGNADSDFVGGGGGAGYGGAGGAGGHDFHGDGGAAQGSATSVAIEMGSGGGYGATNQGTPIYGGNGGGRVSLYADIITVSGIISCNGSDGNNAPSSTKGGGGGGAGGGILLVGSVVDISGTMNIAGGDGGNGQPTSGNGGGGSGGRIKVFYLEYINSSTMDASGGVPGTGATGGVAGSVGTIYTLFDPTNLTIYAPYGYVFESDGSVISGANVTVSNSTWSQTIITSTDGFWNATELSTTQAYNFTVSIVNRDVNSTPRYISQSSTNETNFVLQFSPPNLIGPSNSSTIYTTFPPLTEKITFTWEDKDVPQYRLILAEDMSFNVISIDTHVGTNNSIQTLLVNKQYWWKVYSYDEITYSDPSNVYSFNLTGNSTLTGSAIEGVVYQSNEDITAIPGSEVTIWNATWSSSMITGSNGYYVFEDLENGTVYNLQAKSDRYWDSSIALVSAEADPVTNNFYLIDDLTDTEWWHYVEFTVQNIWDVTYPGVATKVYIGDSPTIYDSGNTESDGTISFHLDQNIRYRITFINSTLGINEEIALYPISKSYTVYIDSYSFDLPDAVTDDIQAYITSSRINATYGYINFTYSDTSDLTTSINYYIHDVDGNELYSTSNSGPNMFDSQIVAATDDRYIVRYVGVHPTHDTIDKTETIVFRGGRRVDFGWDSDWQYAVTALAFLIFIGSMFGAKTAHYGAIAVVMFAWIFKWIGWLDETNTSTLLIVLAAVIAFGWSLRKSEEVKM